MSPIHEVIIVGSGPAGYTAALYAARANLKPLLFAGDQPGGQLMITTDVENYPGFRDAILGPELMARMRDQVLRFGTEIIAAPVERVDFKQRPFTLWSEGKEYRAKSVIIASGASAMLLGIESETKLLGFGVSACATCDAFFFRGKRVMVVGGGDTAMEEATFLGKFASEVIVVHRRDEFRASKIMQERTLNHPKIKVIWDSILTEVLGVEEQKVRGAALKNLKTGAVTEHEIDGIFIAIGHKPNTEYLKGQLPMDTRGYLEVEPGSTRTPVTGVFAAGDVADAKYRQAVTAAGSGCMAAMDVEKWLEAEAHAASAGDSKPAKQQNPTGTGPEPAGKRG